MDLQLRDKTVLITGSTAGIGFATAEMFVAEGASVVINGRRQESVDRALERLRSKYPEGQMSGIPADFANAGEVSSLVDQLPQIDILINNVGVYASQSFFDTSDEEWSRQFEVNVMSGVRLSKALMPGMLERNWGRILFISSECATLVPEDLIAYSTTKAAVLAISRGLAQLTSGSGVTVNTIIPGSTMTEGAEQFLVNLAETEQKTVSQAEADFFSEIRTSSLLQRFAKVHEIVSTIVYFSSPLSVATNGSAIKADGGSMGGLI